MRWPSWLWRQVKVFLTSNSWSRKWRGFESHSHQYRPLVERVSGVIFFCLLPFLMHSTRFSRGAAEPCTSRKNYVNNCVASKTSVFSSNDALSCEIPPSRHLVLCFRKIWRRVSGISINGIRFNSINWTILSLEQTIRVKEISVPIIVSTLVKIIRYARAMPLLIRSVYSRACLRQPTFFGIDH